MRISKADREKLKHPLGKIASAHEVAELGKKGEAKIIAVGDVCGKALSEHGVKPWIWIYDGKEMRKKVGWEIPAADITVRNPRGGITKSLIRAIDIAMGRERTRIFVRGEEDLAALYCIATAPLGVIVVYGQPGRGIVVVDVGNKRRFARRMLKKYYSPFFVAK